MLCLNFTYVIKARHADTWYVLINGLSSIAVFSVFYSKFLRIYTTLTRSTFWPRKTLSFDFSVLQILIQFTPCFVV